jgi:hypothetical protein
MKTASIKYYRIHANMALTVSYISSEGFAGLIPSSYAQEKTPYCPFQPPSVFFPAAATVPAQGKTPLF